MQLQLGAVGQVPRVLGAAGLNWGAEVVYKDVPDLPDPSVTRFGRVDVFGQGPVNGVCPPPAAPSQCTTDGYVSRHALGYRLVAGLRYANVAEGVDLIPSVLFGHDVSGWSGDGAILEGRKLAVASLRAQLAQRVHRRPGLGADLGRRLQQPARPQRRAVVRRPAVLRCPAPPLPQCATCGSDICFVPRGMRIPGEIVGVCEASIDTSFIESHWDKLVTFGGIGDVGQCQRGGGAGQVWFGGTG